MTTSGPLPKVQAQLTQITMVKDFAAHNFLKLNVQKCEFVMFSHGSCASVIPQCEVDGSQIPVRNSMGVCLLFRET